MPPAIVRCEYVRENLMVQDLAAGCAPPASLSSRNALQERGLGFAHPTGDAGDCSLVLEIVEEEEISGL
jgi:hypothetical protein